MSVSQLLHSTKETEEKKNPHKILSPRASLSSRHMASMPVVVVIIIIATDASTHCVQKSEKRTKLLHAQLHH